MKSTRALAKLIRVHALKMTSSGKSSHIGSIFSIADILAVLYGSYLKINPKKPKMKNRDRFILSKGHAGAGVYAALAETGFFPIKKLSTHYRDGSDLSGHVSHKRIPGVELSTGSLGHGLSIGAGMAKAAKLNNAENKVVVLLSDGECDEGSVWEAIMFASHHKLDNLIAIIDYNKLQSLASVEETLSLEPFSDKWISFGWRVSSINGHNHNEIEKALYNVNKNKGRPTVIIANTIKGKGVSFMENQVLWHYRTAQGREYDAAIKELEDD
jgi:transketolase